MNCSKNPERPGPRLLTVSDGHAGQRMDNFLLSTLKGVPKSHLYRLMRKGQIRVNKGRVRPAYRVKGGDIVRIPPLSERQSADEHIPGERVQQLLEQRILHEDDRLLVLNKPSGLAVHGGSGLRYGVIDVVRALRPQLPDLALAHRLDRATSGCLLFAKDRKTLLAIHGQLRGDGMEKHYLALLKGCWHHTDELQVDSPLDRDILQSGERMVRVSDDGKAAKTSFRIAEYFHDCILVDIRIETGRTHQIRVHAAHIGHPVAGDEKYGCSEWNHRMRQRGLRRMFLHASSLVLKHPETQRDFSVTAPLDSDLCGVLSVLRS